MRIPLPRFLLLTVSAAFLAAAGSADELRDVHLKDLKKSPAAAPAPASQPDMPANPMCSARSYPVGGPCPVAARDRFCSGVDECEKFCCCAFSFDVTKWTGVYDWKTVNVLAPMDIPGAIPPGSNDLVDLGGPLRGSKILAGYGGKIATKQAAQALKRLDAVLAALPAEDEPFTVAVGNCYRRAIGNELTPLSPLGPDANAEAVCGELFVMMHLEDKTSRTKKEDVLLKGLHKTSVKAFLMSWPGSTPHATGFACDLVVRDSKGKDCFGVSAGVEDSPTCAIDQRHAVSLLDQAVAKTGGWRLDYEAWHFEWGGSTGPGSCRCQGDDCDKIWPVTLDVGCP